jgi:osmotically-inducible protein OsmY
LVDAKNIDVRVESAKATLTGNIGSYRERIAAAESAYDAGALAVDNQLQVAKAPKRQ